jgi:hypothetical protein
MSNIYSVQHGLQRFGPFSRFERAVCKRVEEEYEREKTQSTSFLEVT